LRQRLACLIFPAGPHSMLPTGQHKPLDRQNETVSAYCAIARTSAPVATDALKIRAPSTCTARPLDRAASERRRRSCSGQATPPCQLCVFSIMTAADSGWWSSSVGRSAVRSRAGLSMPRSAGPGYLGRATLSQCHRFLVIPTRHCVNLSAAVYTVLYDRHAQRSMTVWNCRTRPQANEMSRTTPTLSESAGEASSVGYTRSIRTMVIRFSSTSYSTR
jgi:hypothetical protein